MHARRRSSPVAVPPGRSPWSRSCFALALIGGRRRGRATRPTPATCCPTTPTAPPPPGRSTSCPDEATEAAIVLWTADEGSCSTRPRSAAIKEPGRGRAGPVGGRHRGLHRRPDRGRQRRRRSASEVEELRDQLRADAPDGVTVQVTGPAGIHADLGKVFDGADLRLLLATMLIVAVLLVVTYRSPVLWVIPLVVVGARRPGRRRRRDPDARRGRAALGRHDDRHPLGARLRRRHRLRPAADLPLPRRAAHDRVPARGDGARAAAYGGGGARQRDHGLPRGADAAALAHARDPRARSRLRGRRRGRGDVRAAWCCRRPWCSSGGGSSGRWCRGTATGPPSTPTPSSTRSAAWSRAGRPASWPGRWCCSPSWPAACPGSARVSTRPTSSSTGPRRSPRPSGWPSPSPPAPSSRPRCVTRADGRARSCAPCRGHRRRRVGPGHRVRQRRHPDRGRARPPTRVRRGTRDRSTRLRDALRRPADTHVGGNEAEAIDARAAAERDLLLIVPLILGMVLLGLAAAAALACSARCCWCSPWSRRTSPRSAPRGGSSPGCFGFEAVDVKIPLFAFLFLVALGVDYNIFLVTRAREEAARARLPGGHAARADRHRRRDHQRRHPARRGVRRARRAAAGRARPARHDHLRRRAARHPGRAHHAGARRSPCCSATGSGGRGGCGRG